MFCFGRPGNGSQRAGFRSSPGAPGMVRMGLALALVLGMPASWAAGSDGQLTSSLRTLLHAHGHGYLGVEVVDVTPASSQTLHLPSTAGAEITILDHDAPAGKAGLHVQDVILSANGTRIANAEQFRQMLRRAPSGKKLQLQVERDGQLLPIHVQLEDRRKVEQEAQAEMAQSGLPPGAQGFLSSGDVPRMGSGFHFWSLSSSFHIGALVEPMTPQMEDYLGVANGVMVKSVARRSAAAKAGLRAHDVILQVGEDAVATTSDWERLLRSNEGKMVPIAIQREQMRQTLWLQVSSHRP